MRISSALSHEPFGQPDPDMLNDFTLDELRELPMHLQLGADLSALD